MDAVPTDHTSAPTPRRRTPQDILDDLASKPVVTRVEGPGPGHAVEVYADEYSDLFGELQAWAAEQGRSCYWSIDAITVMDASEDSYYSHVATVYFHRISDSPVALARPELGTADGAEASK
jgi:hypothetical protein